MVSDMRNGTLWFNDEGMGMAGKAVLPTEYRTPILLVCLVLRMGVIIAYLIMEYGFRKDRQLFVPWSDVAKVVVSPLRDNACLVFNAPTFYNTTKVKLTSLAFKLNPMFADAFIAAAQHYVGGRIEERKLPPATSPWVVVLLVVVILAAAIGIAIYAGH